MYFTILDRLTIKLDKNKMDSNFIKSHTVFSLKWILNSDQDLALSTKVDSYRSIYKSQKFTKTEKWRYLYSITLCLATSH